MQQYKAIKAKYKDAILLFRVGDFYELFDEDARQAAGVLGGLFTETKKGDETKDMLSVPHFSLDTALRKLVKAGHRVAVCEQLEDPKTVKGLVRRGVTESRNP